ncbi:MAG: N-methyl-L-tryptophan oxidase [Chloroflexota bacterium]|nr:N-methyl-L-tryptophan oxidase [Chloroflexota bacterium]
MANGYDVIVVGLGAMGSPAVTDLARHGLRVLGLDMFLPGHDQGSSHGHHRMIRRSHWQPAFLPLVERSFERWRALEAETGQTIMTLIGEVSMTLPRDGARYHRTGVDESFGDSREILDAQQLAERYPGFRPTERMVLSYEREAGFLRPEVGIAAHLELAKRHGATIRRPEDVTGWTADGDGVRVTTNVASYSADRLVLSAGPWSQELLSGLGLPLQVVRIVNVYFEPERPDLWTAEQGATDFLLSVPEGNYYGMPSIEGQGVKIGRHENGEPTTARTIRRTIDRDEIEGLRTVLDRYMPGASGPVRHAITCMYTMTPDENYIIEQHPEFPQVVYACGCSGTSYKFSPIIGEILAGLAVDGVALYDISMFASARFAGVAAD